jgi:hypothetical protein
MDTILIPEFQGYFSPIIEFGKTPFWIGETLQQLIDDMPPFTSSKAFEINKKVYVKDRPLITLPQLFVGMHYLVWRQSKGEEGFLCLDGMTTIGPIQDGGEKRAIQYVHLTFFKDDLRWKCSLRDVSGIIKI